MLCNLLCLNKAQYLALYFKILVKYLELNSKFHIGLKEDYPVFTLREIQNVRNSNLTSIYFAIFNLKSLALALMPSGYLSMEYSWICVFLQGMNPNIKGAVHKLSHYWRRRGWRCLSFQCKFVSHLIQSNPQLKYIWLNQRKNSATQGCKGPSPYAYIT